MTRRAGAFAAALVCGCLTAGCRQSLAPSPAVETVDVLDFLIGDVALWPRVGSHYMNQVVDPSAARCAGSNTSTLADSSAGGGTTRMSITQPTTRSTATPASPTISATGGGCHGVCRLVRAASGAWMRPPTSSPGSLPVHGRRGSQRRVSLSATRLVRGEGRRRRRRGHSRQHRARVMPYDPATGSTNSERFYFAKGAGWYRWQRGDAESLFVRTGGTGVAMNRDVWCTG